MTAAVVRRLLLTLALVATASCSVRTPRDGVSAGEGRRAQDNATLADAADADSGGLTSSSDEDGSVAGGASGPGATGASGRTASGGTASDGTGSGGTGSGGTGSGGTGSGGSTSGGSAPGVTANSVTISLSAPFSGTYGALISSVTDAGVSPWVQDVNANGGIHGRQVILKKIDNKATSDGAVGACKEAQSNGTLMTVIIASMNSANIEPDCLDKAAIPVLFGIAGNRPPAWTHVRAIVAMLDYSPATATFVKNYLQDGGKKLGVIYTDGSGNERAELYAAEAKALGMTVVAVKKVEQNQGSFTREILDLREAGAENVTLIVGVEVFGILRDAKALGYAPRWVGQQWGIDEYSQAAPALMQGTFAMANDATSDTPAYSRFSALATKYGYPQASRSSMSVYGNMLVLGEVLKAAGRNLTRPGVVAAFKTINNFDNQIQGSVTWSTGAMVGTSAKFATVCCTADNKWKGLGPARARF